MQIHPDDILSPLPGCCSGCLASLDAGGGLVAGHFACVVPSTDVLAAVRAGEATFELGRSGWIAVPKSIDSSLLTSEQRRAIIDWSQT